MQEKNKIKEYLTINLYDKDWKRYNRKFLPDIDISKARFLSMATAKRKMRKYEVFKGNQLVESAIVEYGACGIPKFIYLK